MDPRSFDILVNDEWRHLARVEEIDGKKVVSWKRSLPISIHTIEIIFHLIKRDILINHIT